MINFDDSDLPEDVTDMDFSMDDDQIIEKLPTFTSQKLCNMIICDRYFGSYQEIAIASMKELAKRRLAGDTYDFETYIEKEYSDLPLLDFAMPDLGKSLRQAIGKGLK